jgi:hypothetical protein
VIKFLIRIYPKECYGEKFGKGENVEVSQGCEGLT